MGEQPWVGYSGAIGAKDKLSGINGVADAGSFKKAAELAYIAPTAVIKQINLMEADLDLKLFERTHRGLTLTKAGKSLYNDAKYMIQYSRDSLVRARNAMQEVMNFGKILMWSLGFLMRRCLHCGGVQDLNYRRNRFAVRSLSITALQKKAGFWFRIYMEKT